MADFVRVAAVAEIPAGGGKAFNINGVEVAVFNLNGQFHAIGNECCHAGWALAGGEMQDSFVICPGHGWNFDVRTGVCGGIPGARVPAYECKVVDGAVYVAA